ncbi:MAG: hypothetical protein ABI846_15450 [Rudaea sp.]
MPAATLRAGRLSNPDNAPHLSFVDMGGHGYTVSTSSEAIEAEFVCIERPLERSDAADGAALCYRVIHRARLRQACGSPKLERRIVDGDPRLSI